jgi:periplasmic divalent cation tolerance protein
MVGATPEGIRKLSYIMGAPLRKESGAQILVILVTAPNQEEAVKIGKIVVKERLAACVNIIPVIQSIYRWRGKVLKSQEVLLLFKTTRARYPALEKKIMSIHTYETPEIIALPVKKGLPQYLGWVYSETHG